MPIKHIGVPITHLAKYGKQMMKEFPKIAANAAINHFKENLERGSWDGRAWQSRAKFNKNDRPLLFSGIKKPTNQHLRNSLTYKVWTGGTRVFVRPPADEYADIHNFGGTVTIPANTKTQKWAWAMFYNAESKEEKDFYRAIALRMKMGKSMVVKIPQRQFLGNSPLLNKKIQQKFDWYIKNLKL